MHGTAALLAITLWMVGAAHGQPLSLREYAERCADYYARQYDVPPPFVRAIIDVESAWNAGIKPDSRASEAIETVIERRHQNGRWPLNLLHPEHIPLEMETGIGRASRWNTLRALRVLHWYNNSTW
jgi:hypothetical protein